MRRLSILPVPILVLPSISWAANRFRRFPVVISCLSLIRPLFNPGDGLADPGPNPRRDQKSLEILLRPVPQRWI